MEYPLTKAQFLKLYFDYSGWNYQEEVLLIENPQLDSTHPLTLIRTLGKLFIEYYPNGYDLENIEISSDLSNQEIVTRLLGNNSRFKEIQSFVKYADNFIDLPPFEGLRVETLSIQNKLEFGRFKAQCSLQDLEKSAIGLEDDELIGIYHQRDLLAIGTLWFLDDSMADLHVLTHPKYRSIGLGKLLLGLLVNRAIRLSRVPIVRGEVQNDATNKIVSTMDFIEAISIFEIHLIP